MADLRVQVCAALAALLCACNSTTSHGPNDAELQAVAPLKQQYSGIVMGFDIRPENTLIVSLDLQRYIETDDDVIAKMKRAALTRWRDAWTAAHPHERQVLHVRFIDFVGRTVAQESTR